MRKRYGYSFVYGIQELKIQLTRVLKLDGESNNLEMWKYEPLNAAPTRTPDLFPNQ